MNKLLSRLISCQYMIKPSAKIGDIPPTAEIYSSMFHVAWPSALEAVLVAMISSVDTMMVGGLGPGAIAAVGITNQPRFIILSMILSLNVGVTAIVARRRGENDQEGANRCLRQSLIISAGLSLLLSAFGFIFSDQIMAFAGAQSDIIDQASLYFRIIMVGIFFNAVNLTVNAAQRGIGNTKISMKTNIVANGVNVVFNYLLINGNFGFPRLEVAGAAIATVLGNIVALCMAIASIIGKDKFLHITIRADWSFDKNTVSGIVKVGSSAMVEQVFLRIGFFVYAKIIAGLGTDAFATHQIASNIMSLSFSFGDGLSIAASSLVGQQLGAKRPDMATIYGKVGQRMASAISCVIFFVFLFGGGWLFSLFTNDADIIKVGAVIMIIGAITNFAQTSQVVISGCLRGAGDVFFTAITSLISVTIIRPLLTWLFCYPLGWGVIGAWFGFLIDQSMRLILNAMRFSTGKWTKIKL